uniref:Copper chaperone n=1 Tax=Zea mays TaxID=4577 RepID=B6TMY1_MAIZE|nr:copper chaperone [Zea mays]
MKPEEVAPAALPAAAANKDARAQEKKPAKDKKADYAEAAAKPSKDKTVDIGEAAAKPSKDEKADKGEAAAKPSQDEKAGKGEPAPETKKGSPAPGKQDAAEEAGADKPGGGGGGKKGKKNKNPNKPLDCGGEAPAEKQASPGPESPHVHGGAFPYYAAHPVLSCYNVAHPSSSVSYYAPAAVVPYGGFPPMVPAEFMYGPPGMQESSMLTRTTPTRAASCDVCHARAAAIPTYIVKLGGQSSCLLTRD